MIKLLTVASRDYLSQAHVLLNSLRSFHPEVGLVLIVADLSQRYCDSIAGKFPPQTEVISADVLDIPDKEAMHSYYTLLEFCTALKIYGISWVLHSGYDCLFLDADTFVLGSLDEALFETKAEISLTTHSFAPMPPTSGTPTDLEICNAGHINSGVMLFRTGKESSQALTWLREKAKDRFFLAPKHGMFLEQNWISSLPYFYPENTMLVRHQGVNVGYWNLQERSLSWDSDSGTILVNGGDALCVLHFSGMPNRPGAPLTVHSSRQFGEQTEHIMAELLDHYRQSVSRSEEVLAVLPKSDKRFCGLGLNERIAHAADLLEDSELASMVSSFELFREFVSRSLKSLRFSPWHHIVRLRQN